MCDSCIIFLQVDSDGDIVVPAQSIQQITKATENEETHLLKQTPDSGISTTDIKFRRVMIKCSKYIV